jgi:putative ABC transport system permease protein
MLKNYIRIAFRHLLHSKLYSIINVIGLATGITCILLAVLYWKDERSFDEFHKNNPHLYRLTTSLRIDNEGNRSTVAGTGQVQGPAFKAAVPEIAKFVRVLGGDIYTNLASENKRLRLRSLFVDSSFFQVFSFPFVKGNPATALQEINGVILTESTARKFFNTADAVGRLFTMDADPSFDRLGKSLIVSGVIKDPPGNSSLQFDALLTLEFMRLSFLDDNWLNQYLGTFIVLHPGANIKGVTDKFNTIQAARGKEQYGNPKYDGFGFDPDIKYGLQPMTDIHLSHEFAEKGFVEGAITNISNPLYSYMFMGIALFILLMAVINFINISIANSLKRAKEVGVRKISGGNGTQIIVQFLIESALLCVFAFLLSILLMNGVLPFFNTVSGKKMAFSTVMDKRLFFYFLVTFITIILITGFYPAYLLSKFRPVEVLYNKLRYSGRGLFGRSLVILQFALAILLVIGAIVYYQQMDFVRTKDLGYNPSSIIRTAISGDINYAPVIGFLKNELVRDPSIKTVSFGNDGDFEKMEVNSRVISAMHKGIDEKYLSLMGITLVAGTNMPPGLNDNSVIVNEAFVREAGLQQPIGQRVRFRRYYQDSTVREIIGVVKDYHFNSLRYPIKPLLMYKPETADGMSGIWIKIDKANQKRAMAAVERVYKNALPKAIYQFDFIDELNAREYLQEQRWQKVINTATVLSLIICCLGLFGLAHLSTNKRTREIGIRKVLGASVHQIVSLLTTDFLKLVGIAVVIASPVAWFVLNSWLQHFAYRIHIGWTVFALAVSVSVFIAIATIGFQTIKAAFTNPVAALRND